MYKIFIIYKSLSVKENKIYIHFEWKTSEQKPEMLLKVENKTDKLIIKFINQKNI